MHAIVLLEDRRCLSVVGGLSVIRRLLRTLTASNVTATTILIHDRDGLLAEVEGGIVGERARCVAVDHPIGFEDVRSVWPADAATCLITPAVVLDGRLLPALVAQSAPVALVDSASKTSRDVCGPVLLSRGWLDGRDGVVRDVVADGVGQGTVAVLDVATLPTYSGSLRRALRPFWFSAPTTPGEGARIEDHLLDATKKGAPDLPAIAHTPIERFLVRLAAPSRVTPNNITVITTIVAWIATYCFATGELGYGLAIALLVGVLDGVDGRLARLRLQTSKLGELEHHLDAMYELSWWLALAYHFQTSGQLPHAWLLLLAWLVAEGIDGVAKLSVLRCTGRTIDEASRFDRGVRLFGGRRNVYVWILSASYVVGNPAAGYALIPWWEGATAAIHVPRALLLWRRDRATASSATPTSSSSAPIRESSA